MKVGTYIGSNDKLKGEKALLMVGSDDRLLAQFDNWELGREYSHNWNQFKASEFEIREHTL